MDVVGNDKEIVMGQALKDVPKNRLEYERQKGPVPLTAIMLVFALIAAFLAFYGPTIIETIAEYYNGEN